ncbi:HEAT repeat domain-containing protein [Calothrix rhizosoleniae]|uniref:HEAT repeat domain-containing protein n=1 Tax=Calothrix rhizosoleniae TaxID=888997 RepID=UPI001F483F85|nr:HEAT repeat domain-containing protein [Calothrix rhizosoleniae]
MLDSTPKFGDDPILLAQKETDELLNKVNEQIAQQTFNPNDHQTMKQMVESLADSRGMARLGIVEAFGEIGNPAAPFLVEGLANHPNPVVRRSCAKALAIIAHPSAVPTLIQALLNDEDTVVRGSAAGALARSGEVAVPELLRVLASPEYSATTKGHAIWALSFMGAEVKDNLYQAIDSDSAEVRAAIVGAIAKVAQEQPEDKPFNILINALSDTAEIVRSEAAAVLGNLAHQPAIPSLLNLLQHTNWESRKAAALALMKIGDRNVLAPLQVALNQEQEVAVQSVIKLAISQIEKQVEQNEWE